MDVSKSFKEKRGPLLFKQHHKRISPDPEVSSGPRPLVAPGGARGCGVCPRQGKSSGTGSRTGAAPAGQWPAGGLQRMAVLCSPAASGAVWRLGHVYGDAKMTSA